jgi:putative phage-type endonuclease
VTLAYEIINTNSREEWLAARSVGIGASEMPVLMGESDWGSNLEIWAAKVGESTEEDEDNELKELGRELEGAILRVTMRRACVSMVCRNPLIRSIEHRWCIATPDAITTDVEPVEVKNLSFGFSDEEWKEKIPEKYRIQCNQQMLATGAQRCLFGVLVWGNRIVWEWVPRDKLLIRRIIRTGDEFWGYVERREQPPSDGHKNARKFLEKRATSEESIELYRDDIDEDVSKYAAANSRLARLRSEVRDNEKTRDAAADAIAQRMGAARHAVTADGWEFAWKRSSRKGYTVEPKELDQFTIKEPKR